jgi:DNA-binding response OmpR family regulator
VRVLLVEDKPQGEKFIWAALNNRWWGGVSLDCKPSFSQALDTLKGESFDVVLVDLAVPDLQGPEALARVGRMAQKLPVIVLIDEEEKDRVMAARDLGIRHWVMKATLTPSRLEDEVKNALALRANQESVSKIWNTAKSSKI